MSLKKTDKTEKKSVFFKLIFWFVNRSLANYPWHERRVYLFRCGRMKSLLTFRLKKEPYIRISSAMNPTTVGFDVWMELVNCSVLKIKSVRWKLYENFEFQEMDVTDLFRPVYKHVDDLNQNKDQLEITTEGNQIIYKTIKL